jgi:hypothetical protein
MLNLGSNIYAGKSVNNLIPIGVLLIESDANVNFIAKNEIILSDGFIAKDGASFNASIDENIIVSCDKNNKTRKCNQKKRIIKNTANSLLQNDNYFNKQIGSEILTFPNPVHNELNIVLSFLIHIDRSTLELTNIFGSLIIRKKFSGSSTKLDLSNYPKGIYFIKIKTPEKTYIKKIIKL